LCLDDVAGLGLFLEPERLVPPETAGLATQAELAGMATALGVDAERVEETYDSLLRVGLHFDTVWLPNVMDQFHVS
jgi:adenylate cyclase class 2